MFTVIAIMLAGVLLGRLLKDRKLPDWLSGGTMLTIVLLLFVMGVEIGSNREVVENLLQASSIRYILPRHTASRDCRLRRCYGSDPYMARAKIHLIVTAAAGRTMPALHCCNEGV